MKEGLLAAILIVFLVSLVQPKYEYTWLRFPQKGILDRTGTGAAKASEIEMDEGKLRELGKSGWEVCGVFLEPETSYPNFGNESYVTGLQPNVRAQSAVILLKKPVRGLKALFTF